MVKHSSAEMKTTHANTLKSYQFNQDITSGTRRVSVTIIVIHPEKAEKLAVFLFKCPDNLPETLVFQRMFLLFSLSGWGGAFYRKK